MNTPEDYHRLEKLIDSALRDLSPRPAPASLELRVLAAIAARQALPWWRQSFVHWPAAIRVLFLVATATMAAVTVWVLLRGLGTAPISAASELITAPLTWWQQSQRALGNLYGLLQRSVSSTTLTWIYFGLAMLGLCYVAVIGAGAAAYRIFWHAPESA